MLNKAQVVFIQKMLREGRFDMEELAKMFDVSVKYIEKCSNLKEQK